MSFNNYNRCPVLLACNLLRTRYCFIVFFHVGQIECIVQCPNHSDMQVIVIGVTFYAILGSLTCWFSLSICNSLRLSYYSCIGDGGRQPRLLFQKNPPKRHKSVKARRASTPNLQAEWRRPQRERRERQGWLERERGRGQNAAVVAEALNLGFIEQGLYSNRELQRKVKEKNNYGKESTIVLN